MLFPGKSNLDYNVFTPYIYLPKVEVQTFLPVVAQDILTWEILNL